MIVLSSLHDFLIKNLSTLFGAGRSSIAPGTMGTLLAAIPFLIWSPGIRGASIMTICSFLIGLYVADKYALVLQEADPSSIVIDELCGMWTAILTCYLLEYSQFGDNGRIFSDHKQWLVGSPSHKLELFVRNALYVVAIFVVFRICDIVKPFPVSFFDKNVSGGLGIMMDDVVAGLMTGIIIYVVAILW